jgi:hypothetical protein
MICGLDAVFDVVIVESLAARGISSSSITSQT